MFELPYGVAAGKGTVQSEQSLYRLSKFHSTLGEGEILELCNSGRMGENAERKCVRGSQRADNALPLYHHTVRRNKVQDSTVRLTCEEPYGECGGMKLVQGQMTFPRCPVRYKKSATKLP